ncbi:MAG: mannose-1-phosphate guanylyltransferase/mannose-6-phosphate isomerase [Brevinematales bacterium]|nr:mannose-1-phosphate guanylyltransferase/mannose-6-phosphate isomerase [Brevinematales bacterium]
MVSIILAGGSGTRLWPYSRQNFPKQFLSLVGNKSLLQMTAERLRALSPLEEIYVVAGQQYRFTIMDHLCQVFGCEFTNLVLEPMGRNTAPAIALTVKYLLEKGYDPETVVFFSPSDHVIDPVSVFAEAVQSVEKEARTHIVTFGIVPTRPETGYGYIQLGKQKREDVYQVHRFVEKPNRETAEQYLQDGNYLWNAGMFLFSLRVILEAFETYMPELYQAITTLDYQEMVKRYSELPSISIDYGVMEKASNILCYRLNVLWNDVGSWDSVYDLFSPDEHGNATSGDVVCLDTKRSLVLSKKHLTALIGVNDLVVVETEDAILIANRHQTQKVKDMVQLLASQKRPEVSEHVTVYRPWGSYTVLEEADRYKIKKIVVNVGAALSLQRHQHRSEHWIVVKGTALVEIEGKQQFVHENESVYVPKSALHRLSNPGKIPLEMIEVQNGEYLGEDDIERVTDNYGRS